jgi:hypothetical protein
MDTQELASKLVDNNIICCVSTLVEGLLKVSSELDYKVFSDAFDIDIDDLTALCQKPDYETAARDFIFNDADAADLERVADDNGYWGDIVEEFVPEVKEVTEEGEDDEDEARESAIESVMPAIREAVWKITTDYEAVCTAHGLDYEYTEALEFWVVSSWLAEKLVEKGESIAEVCGLTVWGRCTSGQAISIDSVIEAISVETYK